MSADFELQKHDHKEIVWILTEGFSSATGAGVLRVEGLGDRHFAAASSRNPKSNESQTQERRGVTAISCSGNSRHCPPLFKSRFGCSAIGVGIKVNAVEIVKPKIIG